MRLKSLAYAGVALMAAGAVVLGSAIAQTTVPTTEINFGTVLYNLANGLVPIVVLVIGAAATWAVALFNKKTGLDIEFFHRDALEAFLNNQAGRFLAPLENLKGLSLDVGNAEIARLAQEALNRIPDAKKFFNLTNEQIAQRIIDKIGIQTAPGVTAGPPPSP